MAHEVFVSHSVKDKVVADAVVARLEAESVSCWVAPRDVVPGADWGESIINAIESSRIMILIFSQSANASPQIKREVERAVNKGVYIIPFRVEDVPPARSLEYFISTSQWMDAFPPPLERHLDNLAKIVKAVLKSPPLPGANVPAQPEKPSTPRPPIPPPPRRKSIPIAVAIGVLMIVGGAGWYLVHKREFPPEKPVVTPGATSTPVATPSAAVTASAIPVPTATTPPAPPISNIINDEEVREFVTNHFRALDRGDVDYVLSHFGDETHWAGRLRDKESLRKGFMDMLKWPVHSSYVSDIRVVHSASPSEVTAYFDARFSYEDPVSGRSRSGSAKQEWVISKTSGSLKIVFGSSLKPTPTPVPTLTTPPPPPISNIIDDGEVREFVTNHFHARHSITLQQTETAYEQDLDHIVSEYDDVVDWYQHVRCNKAFIRQALAGYFKPFRDNNITLSYTVGDIRVVHSAIPDTVTANVKYVETHSWSRSVGKPNVGGSASAAVSDEWVISKKSGALKIVSQKQISRGQHRENPIRR